MKTQRKSITIGNISVIPLGKNWLGGFTIVDKEFAFLDNLMCRNDTRGYAVAWANRRDVKLHRFISGAKDGEVVDHINHNKFDNRLANLRVCSQKDNSRNQKIRMNNTTGYKGVSFYKKRGLYSAYICPDGTKKHLGYFKTAKEAADRYNEEASRIYGEFAHNNLIETKG
jgi:hypothetical protein